MYDGRLALKSIGHVDTAVMSLPDSGGNYYDTDRGGIVGVVRRNVGSAAAKVTSGDVGGQAVGVAVGFVVSSVALKRLKA